MVRIQKKTSWEKRARTQELARIAQICSDNSARVTRIPFDSVYMVEWVGFYQVSDENHEVVEGFPDND